MGVEECVWGGGGKLEVLGGMRGRKRGRATFRQRKKREGKVKEVRVRRGMVNL